MKLQYHPNASLSVDGQSYTADADGVIEVPAAFCEQLLWHGLTPVDETDAPQKRKK